MRCCPISFPLSNGFAIKKLEIIFFNEDILSISFVTERITKRVENTFMRIPSGGITNIRTQKNKV
jgi:hypothetical protein